MSCNEFPPSYKILYEHFSGINTNQSEASALRCSPFLKQLDPNEGSDNVTENANRSKQKTQENGVPEWNPLLHAIIRNEPSCP
mmetsp:Transcript_39980/g.64856  ORF Transcript_39980/g.64856 Transcript_39980/m.64856 type:complete len:83 (-) Transcript_39980:593-841(-)